LKTRLLGAFVLVALLVIFVPMFFSSNPPPSATAGDQSVSLAIPAAQDSSLQTRTMSLTPGAPATSGSAAAPAPAASATAGAPAQTAPAGSQLATVNIPSSRPADVGTDAAAPKTPASAPTTGSGASPSQPVIPLRGSAAATPAPALAKAPVKTAATPVAAAVPPAASPAAPASAAAGDHALYVLNLSAYANASSVDRLVRRVRGFGYPVLTRVVTQAGKQLTLVTAGPFDSRTSAEAARLKITQSIPGVPAKLEAGLGHTGSSVTTMPATHASASAQPAATTTPRAGGYAVQVAAMGSQAEADALRDKLRANGFDGFVDTVDVGGKRLWRVRAGPQTQRADAERVRDQVKAKLGLAGNVVGVP
jgi:cell division septation protein DedD